MEKFRKDYKVADYAIYNAELTFKIFTGYTQVGSLTDALRFLNY
jgi:hypothetical protein